MVAKKAQVLRTSAAALVALLLVGAPHICFAQTPLVDSAGFHIPGEFIIVSRAQPEVGSGVHVRSGAVASDALLSQMAERSSLGITSLKRLDTKGRAHLLRIETESLNACEVILAENPQIESCEPNVSFKAFEVPNDPALLCTPGQNFSTCQWALNFSDGVDIRAFPAWDTTMGDSNAIVAVLDTGLRLDHPDIVNQLWTNPNEIPGNGIDDDNNGFIDDVHGANTLNQTGNPYDDHVGTHGTHVSGIIAAACGNAIGVCGVSSAVKILPVKFLNSFGFGTTATALQAIDYMNALKRDAGQNIIVSNNSWGGMPYSSAILSAIREAEQLGIIFVAAAGNDAVNLDLFQSYPASYDVSTLFVVAASMTSGALAPFSNYGINATDIAAPGDQVLSLRGSDQYGTKSGTSMAAPHVSGVLALAYAANPSLPPFQLRNIVRESASYVSELQGVVGGAGVVNAEGAVITALGATPAPTPTITPTYTASATPTITPTPTITSTPTRTPTTTAAPTVIATVIPAGVVPSRVVGALTGQISRNGRTRWSRRKATSGKRFRAEVLAVGADGSALSADTAVKLELRLGSRLCSRIDWHAAASSPSRVLRGRIPLFGDGNRAIRLLSVGSGEPRQLLARLRVLSVAAPRGGQSSHKMTRTQSESQLCRQLARRLQVSVGALSLIDS